MLSYTIIKSYVNVAVVRAVVQIQIMEIFNFSNSEMRNGAIHFRQRNCFHQCIIVYRDRSNIEPHRTSQLSREII